MPTVTAAAHDKTRSFDIKTSGKTASRLYRTTPRASEKLAAAARLRATLGGFRSTQKSRRKIMRASTIALASVLVMSAPARGADPAAPENARVAFERIKSLSGTWEGRSTKGWVETLRYQVIAGGSVVL